MGNKAVRKQDKIIIDEKKGLVFANEDELYKHFHKEISILEHEFFTTRSSDDIDEKSFDQYEANLSALLEHPDEIWLDKDTLKDVVKGAFFHVFVKKFESEDNENPLYHVALVYLDNKMPSFVYLHFPSNSDTFVAKYRRGEKVQFISFVSRHT